MFLADGYPHKVTERILYRKKQGCPARMKNNEQKRLVLPYNKGLSERICLLPLNIKTIFRSSSILRSFLTCVKSPTPLEEQKCMVYCMLCYVCECGSLYVRETGRQLKTHITEHKKAVTNANPRNATAAHVWNTGHNIQVSETSGIDHEENWYIRSYATTTNTDPGLSLNPCWAAR